MLCDEIGVLIRNLIVEGSPTSSHDSSNGRVISITPSQASGAGPGIQRGPVTAHRRIPESTVNVKITQAKVKGMMSNGRPDFVPISQTFIKVTEPTANVPYLTNAVQNKWGSEYILVTADALQLDDCSGTQGMYSLKLLSLCVYVLLEQHWRYLINVSILDVSLLVFLLIMRIKSSFLSKYAFL